MFKNNEPLFIGILCITLFMAILGYMITINSYQAGRQAALAETVDQQYIVGKSENDMGGTLYKLAPNGEQVIIYQKGE